MSVSETDSSVEIETELPGVEEKDVEIALNNDVLTIKGEKRIESSLQHSDYCHQERTFGKFARSITLPFEPDPKSVKTLFSRGILKITLPKSAAIKQQTVKIPVKSTGLN
jgi:HSP20 family protein